MAAEPSISESAGTDVGLTALLAVIMELKDGSPTAPVTVVVPSLAAGGVLRRRLTMESGALLLVDFTTPLNFARGLAAGLLPEESWRPATRFELDSLIRAELARILSAWPTQGEGPPPRADASLVSALAQAIFELAAAPDDAWMGMRPADSRSRLAFRVASGVRRQAAARGLGLETEMFSAALRALGTVGAGERVSKAGPVIVFGALNLPPVAEAFFDLLAGMTTVRSLELEVGLPEIDERVRNSHTGLRGGVERLQMAGWPELQVVDCPDRAGEVEVALAEVLAAAEGGVAFEKMAILVSDEGEYSERLIKACARALVPVNAGAPRARVRDRAVLAIARTLDFVRSGARVDLVELASLVELEDSRLGLSSARVEELTQRADLTGNLFAWADAAAVVTDSDDASPLFGDLRLPSERSDARKLASYLVSLRESATNLLEALGGQGWESVAFATRRLYGELVRDLPLLYGEDGHQDRSSPLVNSLRTLRILDGLDEAPGEAALFMALDLMSERSGEWRPDPAGVRIAAIDAYLPAANDLVVMVGLDAQGYPRRPARGLLSESARRMSGLLSLSDRAAFSEWTFHAQLRLARRVIMCRPRSASRRAEALFPSPVIQLARSLCGRSGTQPGSRSVASRSSFLAETAGASGSLDDLNRALMLAGADPYPAKLEDGRNLVALPRLGHASTLEQTRTSTRVRLPSGELRRVSTTSVEDWLKCPFTYFGRRVLHVEELTEPEDKDSLDALERGTLMHGVLETIVREQGNASLANLAACITGAAELAERELEPLHRRALNSSATRRFWLERDLKMIKREVAQFVRMDAKFVEPGGASLALERKLERTFSTSGLLGGEAKVRLVGKIDRIDRTHEGLAVIDYKTGSAGPYKAGKALERHKVQLALYAHLMREMPEEELGGDASAVTGYYWFISERKEYLILRVSPADLEELTDVAATAVAGMEAGLFPPGAHGLAFMRSCLYCDPLAGTNPWRRRQFGESLGTDDPGTDDGVPLEREFWLHVAAFAEGGGDAYS